MATHSSVLAWRIPGTGEPGGLPSMGVSQSRTRLKRLSSSSSRGVLCQTRGSHHRLESMSRNLQFSASVWKCSDELRLDCSQKSKHWKCVTCLWCFITYFHKMTWNKLQVRGAICVSVSTGLKYTRCRGCLVQISGQIIREFSSFWFTVANKVEAIVGKVHVCSVVSNSATSCTVLPGSSVHVFPWQEYWSGLPFPSPGDLLDPGIKP